MAIKVYNDRSNCRRAALAWIKAGKAPSTSFDIAKTEDGNFYAVFLDVQGEPIAGSQITAEQAATTPAETPAEDTTNMKRKTSKPARKPARKPAAKSNGAKAPAAAPSDEFRASRTDGLPVLRITSAKNPSYQKRVDAMLEMARAGELAALRKLEINGVNTYAKKLRRYREQLLIACKG